MVDNTNRVPRAYAVKENTWTDPFIAFTSYDAAFECACSLVREREDASATDHIVELPLFETAWKVER